MRLALPLLALAMVAAPAVAEPATKTRTVRIAFDDVDVTTAEGRAALEARIDAKLRRACTFDVSRYTFGRAVVDSQCFADARAVAMTEVDRVVALKAGAGRTVAVK